MNFQDEDGVTKYYTLSAESRLQKGQRLVSRMVATLAVATLLCACSGTPLVETSASYRSYTLYTDTNPQVCNNPDDIVLRSIVRVATGDGGDASGVVVADGKVLTAAHVVAGSNLALVRIDGAYRHAELLGTDATSDLALLAVDTGSLQPLPLAQKTLYSFEQVWAIGYPLALEQVTTHGFFRNNAQGRLFASAPIQAGASGGGLMRCENGKFELAGLIRGYGAYRIGNELVPLNDLSIHTPAEQIQRFVLQTDGIAL
ncbi:MAG: serine protease [Gammaproteobacteria bacterium]|nr:serine protease [Gammaproteobacteria bacterium]NND60535.1 trypsin-like peptidase domain-containing protein [Gammaproteobacteria bacterium]